MPPFPLTFYLTMTFFDATIVHADDVLSFMASMGVVIIVAFIDIMSVP